MTNCPHFRSRKALGSGRLAAIHIVTQGYISSYSLSTADQADREGTTGNGRDSCAFELVLTAIWQAGHP